MKAPERSHVKNTTAVSHGKTVMIARYHDRSKKTTCSLLSVKQTTEIPAVEINSDLRHPKDFFHDARHWHVDTLPRPCTFRSQEAKLHQQTL